MKKDKTDGLSWYSKKGLDQDVVISSRVRLARNLMSFPFTHKFHLDDAERVQSIIFDAFSQLEGMSFHAIPSEALTPENRLILEERGVLKTQSECKAGNLPQETGILMNQEGDVSAVVNQLDHLHVSCFKSGLDLRSPFEKLRKIDLMLQEKLQFANSSEFGYLTASLRNAGSGMKLSAAVHLPASLNAGKLSVIIDYIHEKKCSVKPLFPSLYMRDKACTFFLVETEGALSGSEIDQIAGFEALLKYICECERKISADYADNKSTVIRNFVIRAYSLAKFSMLISLREAVDIISDVKYGLQLGIVKGVELSELSGLLYRIRNGHLAYLINSSEKLEFEKDVQRDTRLKLDRLRGIILQETFENITLGTL